MSPTTTGDRESLHRLSIFEGFLPWPLLPLGPASPGPCFPSRLMCSLEGIRPQGPAPPLGARGASLPLLPQNLAFGTFCSPVHHSEEG